MSDLPVFITSDDCRNVLQPEDVLEVIEQVLLWDGAEEIQWPTPRSLNIAPDKWGNDYHVKACVLQPIPVAGLRLVSHPLDEASPICTRLIVLIDPRSATLLAIVDETWNYAQRTVASIALASRLLASSSPASLAIVGAGRLARTAVDYYSRIFDLAEVRVASRREGSRTSFVDELTTRYPFRARATDTIREAVVGAQLVLTATSSTTPLLEESWIGPGAVVASVGTAEPGRGLVESADLFIVDSREQLRNELVSEYGESAPALIDATVGEIVAGAHPGRTAESQRVLIVTEGVASQDIALAHVAYTRSLKRGLGRRLGSVTSHQRS